MIDIRQILEIMQNINKNLKWKFLCPMLFISSASAFFLEFLSKYIILTSMIMLLKTFLVFLSSVFAASVLYKLLFLTCIWLYSYVKKITVKKYNLQDLKGFWSTDVNEDDKVSGIAICDKEEFELKPVYVEVSFSNINNIDGFIVFSASAECDVYQKNFFKTAIKLHHEQQLIKVKCIRLNTWCYEFLSNRSKIILTLKSKDIAEIKEEGNYVAGVKNFTYKVSYRIIRRNKS